MRTGLGSTMQARKGNKGAEMRNRLTSVLLGTLVHKGSANDPRNKQGRDVFEGKKNSSGTQVQQKRRHGIERKISSRCKELAS